MQEPSFLPMGSSSSTPAQCPTANSVEPPNLMVPFCMCMQLFVGIHNVCMYIVLVNQFMMGPDKPVIPGQWLFRAC